MRRIDFVWVSDYGLLGNLSYLKSAIAENPSNVTSTAIRPFATVPACRISY